MKPRRSGALIFLLWDSLGSRAGVGWAGVSWAGVGWAGVGGAGSLGIGLEV